MRVALVCPYDLSKPGGVQDQVIRLGRWLDDAGHESVIVGPGAEGPEGAVLVGSAVGIPANRSSAPIALDPRVLRRVRGAVDGCDVVHIHEPLMPMVSLAATRIDDLPTVGTFHADASTLVRRVLRLGGPLTRAIVARLDVRTAVSSVASSSVQALSGLRIIPNGVDVDEYQVGDKTAHSVVFLGRDDPRKGLDVLIEAWPAVHTVVPDATLTVVGADRGDQVDGVTYLGRVSEEDKRAALASSAVYAAPNTGGESFGIVVIEAMASGCAVIASAIPAFARVVGDAGELVKPGDPGGLADRIVTLLLEPERRVALGSLARERAWMFDGATVAASYLEAYADAISIHGR